MIKINKHDAKWLKLATSKDKRQTKLSVVNVYDSKWGHVAVATDGYRLHLVEVDASVPNGCYTPLATGELKPFTMEDKYPDWEYIVAPDKAFAYPCDHLDKCERVQVGHLESYAFGKVTVQVKLLDDAVSQAKAYRIDAQDSPTKPVKVTFLGARTHFALIMPTHSR
jgi:hypothetical protein